MKIIKLELVGYKRMKLAGGKYFSIQPHSDIQLILGTNGSGKSSLGRELSPLPANQNDFTKEGSKTIEITHRGNKYVLRSWFTHGSKHSFLKNDEEFNDGGTTRVQLDLVKREFRYTPEIHSLLTGETRFTRMSPSKRRENFTTFSDQSYDFALSLFQKLKERHRDVTGALKLAKKRLVIEVASVINKDEKAKLQAEVMELTKEAQAIMEQRTPMDRDLHHYEMVQENILNEIEGIATRILKTKIIAPSGTSYRSKQEVLEAIDHYRHKVTELETLINAKTNDFTKYQKDVEALRATGQQGIADFQRQLDELRESRNEVLAKRRLCIEGFDIANAVSALESVYEPLFQILSTIPPNSDRRYSQAKMQEATDKLLSYKDKQTTLVVDLQKLNGNKNHLEAHKANGTIDCPNCTHRWIPNFSEQVYQQVLENIDIKTKELEALQVQIKDCETIIQEIRDYGTQFRSYMSTTHAWPVLRPFWSYLDDQKMVIDNPRQALTHLDILRSDFSFEHQAHRIDIQIEEVKRFINIANQVGDANLADVSSKLDAITEELSQLTNELHFTKRGLADNQQYIKQIDDIQNLWEHAKTLLANSGSNNMELVTAIRNKFLNQALASIRSTLLVKESVLHEAELKEHAVYDLEQNIGRLEMEETASKLLVRELSPTDGLIAEGLIGFINLFTKQMNNIIKKIWTYPLQILPIKMEEDGEVDLDYKFPMMVQDSTNVADDVADGSTAMQEIIDLAYKVVAMKYLGLEDFPLLIDEFGASFDEAHRPASMHAIKNMMDTMSFSQLFMVSHYQSIYGAFTSAEICVLCDSNITVPVGHDYNKHVRIE